MESSTLASATNAPCSRLLARGVRDVCWCCCQHCAQVTALKNLNLNIRKAKVGASGESKFFLTESATSEKLIKSQRIEEIR